MATEALVVAGLSLRVAEVLLILALEVLPGLLLLLVLKLGLAVRLACQVRRRGLTGDRGVVSLLLQAGVRTSVGAVGRAIVVGGDTAQGGEGRLVVVLSLSRSRLNRIRNGRRIPADVSCALQRRGLGVLRMLGYLGKC